MFETAALIIPALIAGVLTFLAPCTLPLVPGYLTFISGTSIEALKDPEKASQAKRKIFLNAILYVLGFSLVFIILGSLFGLGGQALSQYRSLLAQIGGVFVIFFGLYMMHIIKLPVFDFLSGDNQPKFMKKLTPGNPTSSFIFGATFAFGWTPCVGPVLGTILTLAATSATVLQGAFLLFVFSLGLAIPFLLIALGIGSASNFINKISKYLNAISFVGGLFLVFLGYLLITNQMSVFLSKSYEYLEFLNYEALLDYL